MATSNYFARVFSRKQVMICVAMLEDCAGRKYPVNLRDETFKIDAPDGDMVFAGLRIRDDRFICRLHREVFDPAATRDCVA